MEDRVDGCRCCGGYLYGSTVEFARTDRDHYCSLKCYRKDHPLTARTCKVCDKEFEVHPSQLKHRPAIYCSRECYHKDGKKKVVMICEQCEGSFEIYKSVLKHNSGRFCSRACYRESIQPQESGDNA